MRLTLASLVSLEQAYSDTLRLRGVDALVDSGIAFRGFGSLPGAAGVYSAIQLRNPVGSGVRVLVDSLLISTRANIEHYVSRHGASIGGSSSGGVNLRDGGASSQAVIDYTGVAAHVGTHECDVTTLAYSPFLLPLPYPTLLTEGDGIVVQSQAVFFALRVTFVWREI